MKNNKKGFTLIELLVVISIIGLLSTISVVALNGARKKGRDAKRVGDIRQIQTALELYFNDNYVYPTEASAVTLGATGQLALCDGGFGDSCTTTTYMGIVPAAPTPPTGNAYTYTSPTGGATYTITFTLEEATGGYLVGAHTASQNGIQ
jgi:general secretion pathway protein G